MTTNRHTPLLALFCAALFLGGCQSTDLSAPSPLQQEPAPQNEGSGDEEQAPLPSRNRAPWIEGAPGAQPVVGQPFEFTPTAGDPDGDSLTFRASGLPGWASFDPSSGRISGTPATDDAGTSSEVRISVSDGAYEAFLPPFTLQIDALPGTGEHNPPPPPPENRAPSISGTPATSVTVGDLYRFTPSASDPDGDSLAFSVSGLPAWASFDRATGTVEGRPGAADVGVHGSIRIEVSDGQASALLPLFSITVNDLLPAGGETIYVDNTLSASCTDYAPASRSCGGGSARAYASLRGAADAARAGDRVVIRGGTYTEGLYPGNSGTPDQPIVFTAAEGETVTITGSSLSPAIDISGRSHLVIRGLTVDGVRRWLHARNAHYNRIENNTFRRALDPYRSSKTGVYLERATFNKVLNNTIEDGTADNLSLIDADRNLIEGNRITKGGHALWVVKCGDFNVIRNNYFHNSEQKIGEIYDCDGVGFENITAIDATRRNLVEGNEFAFTPSSGNSSPYAGIQYAGQQGIIRDNLFHHTTGPGLSMTLYGGEATRNWGNRVYHNVFFRTALAGIALAGENSSYVFRDNQFKNNILAESIFVANDTRWSWYTGELDGKPVQIKTGRLDGYLFEGNAISGSGGDEPYLITHGVLSAASPARTVSEWERAHPALFRDTITAAPLFRDGEALDLHLTGGSPLIDSGTFLTRATGSGNGTALTVEDASFFYDGFGIEGEPGDEIQLEGSAVKVRIVSIDYANNILHLDTPVSWTVGQGVTRSFNGQRPDIGPFEY